MRVISTEATVAPPRQGGSRRRVCDDKGSALLETAIVTPVFIALLFGILEFGLLMRVYLTVSDTVLDGARVGAVQGPNPTSTGATADFSTVKSLRESLGGIPIDQIDRIVIFRGGPASAGTPMQQVPGGCKSSGGSSTAMKCNVYDAQDAFMAVQVGDVAYFECDSAGDPACGWNPDDRLDGPKASDIEYVGVYVAIDYQFVTGLYGTSKNLDAAAIQRIEPGPVN